MEWEFSGSPALLALELPSVGMVRWQNYRGCGAGASFLEKKGTWVRWREEVCPKLYSSWAPLVSSRPPTSNQYSSHQTTILSLHICNSGQFPCLCNVGPDDKWCVLLRLFTYTRRTAAFWPFQVVSVFLWHLLNRWNFFLINKKWNVWLHLCRTVLEIPEYFLHVERKGRLILYL